LSADDETRGSLRIYPPSEEGKISFAFEKTNLLSKRRQERI